MKTDQSGGYREIQPSHGEIRPVISYQLKYGRNFNISDNTHVKIQKELQSKYVVFGIGMKKIIDSLIRIIGIHVLIW